MRNGQKIATCGCGRKYYVYSMTVTDQHLCPICREADIEGAEATEREVAERARRKATPQNIEDLLNEAGMRKKKKNQSRFDRDDIFIDEARNRGNTLMCCCEKN